MAEDRSEPVPLRTADGQMETDHHQFLLVGDGWPDADEEPIGGQNGLVEVRERGLTILTGAQYGAVSIHVALYDQEPPPPLTEWDEIVDVSFTATDRLVFVELMGEVNAELPNLAFLGPGDYRLRFCASGRDGDDERHAVLVWPALSAPSHVHRSTDRTGAAFRGEPAELTPAPPRAADLVAAVTRLAEITARPTAPVLSGQVRTVQRRRRVPAGVIEVYEAVRQLDWWLGYGGVPAFDPGQLFTLSLERSIGLKARGTVLIAEQDQRLRFSLYWTHIPFAWQVPDPASMVDIEFQPAGAETVVHLSHQGVPAEWTDDVDLLWAYYLDRLVAMTTSAPVGHHPWNP